MQLIGLVLAFAVILVLVSRRTELSVALVLGTAIVAVASRMSPHALALSVWHGLTQAQTVELVLDVALITSLAGVLKRFGLLDTMVRSVSVLLGGARLAIMAVPSIIGMLPVLGGAILSAPMVDGLGEKLGLTRVRRAAVNLVFRHAWFYVAPFSPSLVLAAQLAGVPVGSLIARQAPMAVAMVLSGYLFLLHRTGRAAPCAAESATAEAAAAGMSGTALPATPREAAGPFLRSFSPLILSVGLTVGIGGWSLPLDLSVAAGLALALWLSRRHPEFRLAGLPAALESVQWRIVLTMAAVMVFGRVMQDSGTASALATALVASGLPAWALVVILPLAIGYVAGAPAVPIGIAFPTLLPLAQPGRGLALAAALYCSGFLAYLVSPLHLCQVLTGQYFRTTIPRLYREYWPVALVLAAGTGVYVWLAFR